MFRLSKKRNHILRHNWLAITIAIQSYMIIAESVKNCTMKHAADYPGNMEIQTDRARPPLE